MVILLNLHSATPDFPLSLSLSQPVYTVPDYLSTPFEFPRAQQNFPGPQLMTNQPHTRRQHKHLLYPTTRTTQQLPIVQPTSETALEHHPVPLFEHHGHPLSSPTAHRRRRSLQRSNTLTYDNEEKMRRPRRNRLRRPALHPPPREPPNPNSPRSRRLEPLRW